MVFGDVLLLPLLLFGQTLWSKISTAVSTLVVLPVLAPLVETRRACCCVAFVVVVFVSFDLLFRELNGLGKNGQRNVLGTWQEIGVEGDGRGFRLGLLLRRGRRLGLSLACIGSECGHLKKKVESFDLKKDLQELRIPWLLNSEFSKVKNNRVTWIKSSCVGCGSPHHLTPSPSKKNVG